MTSTPTPPPPAGPLRAPGVVRGLLLALAASTGGLLAGCAARTAEQPFGQVPREVRVRLDTAYYDVQGDTWEALHRSMERRGPRNRGTASYGLTRWEVEYRFRFESNRMGCVLTEPRVVVRLRTTLPRWHPPSGTSDALRRRWSDFVERVEKHERVHQEYAVEAGSEIVRRVKGRRSRSCRKLRKEANREARSIVEYYRRRNAEFDEQGRRAAGG